MGCWIRIPLTNREYISENKTPMNITHFTVHGAFWNILHKFLLSSGTLVEEPGDGRCHDSDDNYTEGHTWSLDNCTICLCHRGIILCEIHSCSPVLCTHPVQIEGHCCPQCPGMRRNFVLLLVPLYSLSVQWNFPYLDTSVPKHTVQITEYPDEWVSFYVDISVGSKICVRISE